VVDSLFSGNGGNGLYLGGDGSKDNNATVRNVTSEFNTEAGIEVGARLSSA
jgi:hypothetical protein